MSGTKMPLEGVKVEPFPQSDGVLPEGTEKQQFGPAGDAAGMLSTPAGTDGP